MFPVSEKMITRKWILRKEILLFVVLTAFVTSNDVLCLPYERRSSVFGIFRVW